MRKLENILKAGSIAVVLALTTVVSHAQTIPPEDVYVTLDEMGVGNIWGAEAFFGVSPFAMPGVMRVEPISGLTALRYSMPLGTQPVTSGDVFLYEPGSIIGQDAPSDLIRFSGNRIWFFSDLDDVPPQLADVGVPAPNPLLPVLNFYEEGTEGNWQGLHYVVNMADPTQPGWSPDIASAGADVTFSWLITSDVPEPSTFALLGLGGLLVLLRKRR